MGFYKELSRHYDELFPANREEMAFIETLLEGRRSALDVGCGTGNKTALLARGDRDIVGIDGDPDMIAVAKRRHAKANIHYMTLDMRAARDQFADAGMDAAICLGNTLAHLVGQTALEDFLRDMATILTPDGVLIIQIINYDRILDREIDELPLITRPKVRFARRYHQEGNLVRFTGELTVRGGGKLRNSVLLRPIRRAELDEALAAAGFRTVKHFGGYDGSPFAADESFHLIVDAAK